MLTLYVLCKEKLGDDKLQVFNHGGVVSGSIPGSTNIEIFVWIGARREQWWQQYVEKVPNGNTMQYNTLLNTPQRAIQWQCKYKYTVKNMLN